MRSSLVPLLVLAACAKPNPGAVCHPVSSWAAPVYECQAAPPPPPPAPPPEPAPAPPPPEPPPPKVEVKEEKIELKETVEFETDSAKISDKSDALLDEVVQAMKDHPEILKIEIQGHTDSTASKKHNLKLSHERAAAVRQYLIDHGIEADRMVSKGYGESKPIASNKTEEGRAQNRRVEIHILKRK
ncbi:MAG TPA: OmpA family protein [Kofleriaceae bacterium]|nr:OmpA family protein [Kofleriaceae bacterium]